MFSKFVRIFVGVFAGVGAAALIAAGIMIAVLLSFRQGAVLAQGELVYGPPTSYGYSSGYMVSFTAEDGKQYLVPPGYYSSGFFPGKQIMIYYHPDNPLKTQNASVIWFSAIPGGIGLLFLVIALVFGLVLRQKKGPKKRLLETGRWITADIESVQPNFMIRVNYRCPYIITCRYTDPSGVTYAFRSENLWDDPEYVLQKQNITTLPVCVDRDNYRKYYVDVSGLKMG